MYQLQQRISHSKIHASASAINNEPKYICMLGLAKAAVLDLARRIPLDRAHSEIAETPSRLALSWLTVKPKQDQKAQLQLSGWQHLQQVRQPKYIDTDLDNVVNMHQDPDQLVICGCVHVLDLPIRLVLQPPLFFVAMVAATRLLWLSRSWISNLYRSEIPNTKYPV